MKIMGTCRNSWELVGTHRYLPCEFPQFLRVPMGYFPRSGTVPKGRHREMKKESGLKSGLLNDAIFTGEPTCHVRAITHHAPRTTHYALRPRLAVILIGEVVHANQLFTREESHGQ